MLGSESQLDIALENLDFDLFSYLKNSDTQQPNPIEQLTADPNSESLPVTQELQQGLSFDFSFDTHFLDEIEGGSAQHGATQADFSQALSDLQKSMGLNLPGQQFSLAPESNPSHTTSMQDSVNPQEEPGLQSNSIAGSNPIHSEADQAPLSPQTDLSFLPHPNHSEIDQPSHTPQVDSFLPHPCHSEVEQAHFSPQTDLSFLPHPNLSEDEQLPLNPYLEPALLSHPCHTEAEQTHLSPQTDLSFLSHPNHLEVEQVPVSLQIDPSLLPRPSHHAISESLLRLSQAPSASQSNVRQAPPVCQTPSALSPQLDLLSVASNEISFNLVPPGLNDTCASGVPGMIKTLQTIQNQVLTLPSPTTKPSFFANYLEKLLPLAKASSAGCSTTRKTPRDAPIDACQAAEPSSKRSKTSKVRSRHA